ncbi:MAG: rhomboid family intramembrane serine protease [Candidatus Firestonebacteria bacterium]|nr:rhomboid family intramembrane serine protease [Candidatus Firestonebacteria bacterium]
MPSYRFTSPSSSGYGLSSLGRPWTPAVKWLILTNLAVFLVQGLWGQGAWTALLSLQLPEIFIRERWWQPFTYLFLHAGFWHLFFNMFTLWMFGCEVELALGLRRFLFYYFLTGAGAGLCVAGLGQIFHEQSMTVGASGAIFGILLAYGVLFAERSLTLLVFFVFPVQMKAKTMVWFFAAIEFVAGVGNALGRVSHVAHLSGILVGYLYFLSTRPGMLPSLKFWKHYKFWRLGKRVRTISPRQDPESYVDDILEKISRQGMGSLNAEERRIMSEAARRRREKNPWGGNN